MSSSVLKDHTYKVVETVAKKDIGVTDAFAWLAKQLKQYVCLICYILDCFLAHKGQRQTPSTHHRLRQSRHIRYWEIMREITREKDLEHEEHIQYALF